MKKTLLLLGFAGAIAQASAQNWLDTGNPSITLGTNFLGAINNAPIDIRTNNTQRFRLNHNVSYTIGSFAAQAKNGALGLSPNNTLWTNGPGPFSRLHLHDGTTAVLSASYRPWMDNGVSLTTNSDQMFVGHKVEAGSDQTSAVFQWGDNEGAGAGPDVMKFIFTSGYSGAGTGPASTNGREITRMHPSGFVGIGDWQAVGLQPDERLDVLDQTVRIRRLIPDYQNDALDAVVVSDANGRLHWRDASTLNGSDCDWVVQSLAPHVSSVYPASNCAWNEKHGVGIGVPYPKMKLQVFHDNEDLLDRIAIWGSSRFLLEEAFETFGIVGEARPPGEEMSQMVAIGVLGDGEGSKYCHGVEGRGRMDQYTSGYAAEVFGVSGLATAADNADWCVGVYGKASGASSGNDWGAWFEGEGFLGGSSWTYSDEQLKTNIEDVSSADALSGLMQLRPKHYNYNTEAFDYLSLSESPQTGLIAQQVEQVFPELARDVHRPERVDSTGTVVEPAIDFKAMNYVGLIPVMIAAMQEQQAQIDQLSIQLASCCAAQVPVDGSRSTADSPETESNSQLEGDRTLRIVPNPFETHTTVYYELERSGRMQLLANSSDGKELRVLHEANMEAGNYQFEWATGDLAPGMYYVTLLLDGQPITKRAVKIAR